MKWSDLPYSLSKLCVQFDSESHQKKGVYDWDKGYHDSIDYHWIVDLEDPVKAEEQLKQLLLHFFLEGKKARTAEYYGIYFHDGVV